ncbi:MAG: PAS domain-containing protein, partial [Bacteroidales bacterium]|nr:PAS domain-containing protein [Bacteroidales bacterium]
MKFKLNNLFWILSLLLLILISALTYYVFKTSSFKSFFLIEGLIALIVVYLFIFYRIIIKPLQIIGGGMELLKEQDFSSRLRHVGQPEADKIVDVFNRMMEQLKNERLHLREQNHFLDLLIEASPMGVIILDLNGNIISMNPAARKIFNLKETEEITPLSLQKIDNPLIEELTKIEPSDSQIIRLSNAHIYKCMHSSFINKGLHQSFYMIESLTEEVFMAEKKAYEKVIRMIAHEVKNTT